MYLVRTYLCPRVKVVVAGPDREWLVVLMIDAAVIQAGGRRVVTLSTARRELSFKRSMITRCAGSSLGFGFWWGGVVD